MFQPIRHSHSTLLTLLFLLAYFSPLLIPWENVSMPVFGINSLHRKRISPRWQFILNVRGSIKRGRNSLSLESVGCCGFEIAHGFKAVIVGFRDAWNTTTRPPIISEEITLRTIVLRDFR